MSSHAPPSDFEIDLLKRNLPEEGRKKLYGCESLSTAWLLLDKMYGDQKLIIQKLKSKLRNLKPKSKEPHEVVIELADEVEYLIKRLRMLEATAILSIDNDFLNSVYKNLPEFQKQKWDDFNQDGTLTSGQHLWLFVMTSIIKPFRNAPEWKAFGRWSVVVLNQMALTMQKSDLLELVVNHLLSLMINSLKKLRDLVNVNFVIQDIHI